MVDGWIEDRWMEQPEILYLQQEQQQQQPLLCQMEQNGPSKGADHGPVHALN